MCNDYNIMQGLTKTKIYISIVLATHACNIHYTNTSLMWPDCFFPIFFVVAEKFFHHHKEKQKKAVWPRETIPTQI